MPGQLPVRVVLSLLLAGPAACDQPDARAGDPAAIHAALDPFGQVVVTGRIIVDSTHATSLYAEEGRAVSIQGELTGELRRLHGAYLTVVGQLSPPGGIQVTSYAILEVNGEKPQVGVIVRQGETYLLIRESGAIMLDPSATPAFDALVGARIWATGTLEGGRLRPVAYGVLRPPECRARSCLPTTP